MDTATAKKIFGEQKAVPILRTADTKPLMDIARAVQKAGGKILEFTMTIPGILDALPKIKGEFPDLLLGMGTVLRPEDASAAIQGGADFIVSHILNLDIVDAVKSQDRLLMLAGFTPTEIHNAHMAGSDVVKIFPATAIDPSYIASLRGPMPNIDFLPTGGVDLLTGLQFLQAGAFAVGVGGTVFKKDWVKAGNYEAMTQALENIYYRINQAFPKKCK